MQYTFEKYIPSLPAMVELRPLEELSLAQLTNDSHFISMANKVATMNNVFVAFFKNSVDETYEAKVLFPTTIKKIEDLIFNARVIDYWFVIHNPSQDVGNDLCKYFTVGLGAYIRLQERV